VKTVSLQTATPQQHSNGAPPPLPFGFRLSGIVNFLLFGTIVFSVSEREGKKMTMVSQRQMKMSEREMVMMMVMTMMSERDYDVGEKIML
jgi:hypothetical protein